MDMSLPSVTFIIPNYNDSELLPQALEAALHQSHPPDEVIVIDDASTDGSMEIIHDYAKRYPTIRVMENAKNLGAARTLQLGYNAVRTDYFCSGSANDYILPGALELMLHAAAEHPSLGIIWGCSRIADWHDHILETNGPTQVKQNEVVQGTDFIQNVVRVQGFHYAQTCSSLLHKKRWDELGAYIPEMGGWADGLAWQMMNIRYGGLYLGIPITHFRLNVQGAGAQNISTIEKQLRSCAKACRYLFTEPLNQTAPNEYQKALAGSCAGDLIARWEKADAVKHSMRTDRIAARLAKLFIPRFIGLFMARVCYEMPVHVWREFRVKKLARVFPSYVEEEFRAYQAEVPPELKACLENSALIG